MRAFVSSLMLGSVVIASGCGGGGAETPVPVYPVSGKITYKGQPVTDASVTFHNEDTQRSSFGRTNDQGQFTLTTFTMNDGAMAGKNIVTVVKVEVVTAPEAPDTESEAYDPLAVGKDTPPPKPMLPQQYGKKETSDLLAVITPDGPREFNFELTD